MARSVFTDGLMSVLFNHEDIFLRSRLLEADSHQELVWPFKLSVALLVRLSGPIYTPNHGLSWIYKATNMMPAVKADLAICSSVNGVCG